MPIAPFLIVSAAAAQDAGEPDAGTPDAAAAEPQEEPLPEANRPRLTLNVTPRDGVMTGDVVSLTIEADALAADDVAVPTQSFEPFMLRNRNARVDAEEDGRHRFHFELELLALEPGEHVIGPLRIRVITGDGQIGHVETERIPIRVGAVLGNEPNAQPKPPSDPVDVLQKDYTLLYILLALLGVLLVIGATLLVARWWRKRPRPAPPPPPARPPWEIALEKLEALRVHRDAMLGTGKSRQWVDGLSDAVREYLGGRYGFDGLESTTDECLQRLRRFQVGGTILADVTSVLGECDLVKFAKVPLGPDRAVPLLEASVRVVRSTTPFRDFAAPVAPVHAAPPPPARPPSPGVSP